MSLALALNNALSGLNVNQQSLAVLSQNIANANTAGYSRKLVLQQAVTLNGNGAGVSILDVTRKVDDYLIRSVRLQGSTVGRTGVISDYLDRTQILLGSPGAGNSVDHYINAFFSAVQSLALSPESATQRVGVINAGRSLVAQAQQLARGLQDLRVQADQDIVQAINAINKDILDIQALNVTITQQKALGQSTADLEDRRDAALRDLAQYLDVETYLKSNGELNIFTASGISLLDDSAYRLSYSPAPSGGTFANNAPLAPILITRLDAQGNPTESVTTLVTGGVGATIGTVLTTGKLKGLLDLRDRQIPNMEAQLDLLIANLRDQFNRIHNAGVAFPGANSYTGTRALLASDYRQWSGMARIALLGADGQPIDSPYPDETSGVRPLLLDLANLDMGLGAGNLTVQGIIDEINSYYGAPQNKAVVGNLNNIRLASAVSSLPGSPPEFSFDFDLENISATGSNFFVTGIQVLDDTAADITSITADAPSIDLAATGTYVTTMGSTTVTVTATLPPGVEEGDTIYLSTPPGGPYDGIPAASLGGFFTVSNISGNSFEITVDTPATAGASIDVAGQEMRPPYAQVEAGEYGRTTADGTLTASLAGNSSSAYYTINVDVAVEDGEGNITTSTLTYRVNNSQSNLLNDRYSVTGVAGGGTMVAPTATQPLARAMLVDANGNELPKSGGVYTTTQQGYLKIIAGGSSQVIAIDSLDSNEEGGGGAAAEATNRGFSHYFELNNFFQAWQDADGDEVHGSAANLAIEERLLGDPNLLSLGSLVQSPPPVNPDDAPLYTYVRNIGDNSIIQQMALLHSTPLSFSAAGGLGASTLTFAAYAGALIGVASTNAQLADSDRRNAQTLMDGFAQRSDAISGVNLDEELANTIIYQNAFTASAKVITVTDELYEALLQSF